MKDENFEHFVDSMVKKLIEECQNDDVLLTELLSHLDSTLPDDLRRVLSEIRNDKINTIINEKS
jgi:myosin-crossreactive antigen